MAEDQAAGDAGKVVPDRDTEPATVEKSGHRLDLPGADLDAGDPSGLDQARDFGREPAIVVEAVIAGKQRLVRLEAGDVGGERGALLDIGRIAQDEVEPLVDPVRPISGAKLGASGKSARAAAAARFAQMTGPGSEPA